MTAPSTSGPVPPPPPPSPSSRSSKDAGATHGWAKRIVASLAALGVLGSIGAYYVPGVLSRGAEEILGVAPLQVTVDHPGDYTTESFYTPIFLFPNGGTAPEDVPAEVLGRDAGPGVFARWARSNGAVPAQDQSMRLTLRGRTADPVIVHGLRAQVVGRADATAGWFTHDRGCGGVELREADADLDASPPAMRFRGLDGDDRATERLALALQVSDTDIEVIDVVAHTHTGTVQWHLEVLYESAGSEGVIVVDDGGAPFTVTATADGHARFYRRDFLAGVFVREPTGDPVGNRTGLC